MNFIIRQQTLYKILPYVMARTPPTQIVNQQTTYLIQWTFQQLSIYKFHKCYWIASRMKLVFIFILQVCYAMLPHDTARKVLLIYISKTQNGAHYNMQRHIQQTFFQLKKQLFNCKMTIIGSTQASSDGHVVLPMCGTIWTPSRRPITSKWRIKTHQMMIINATFSIFPTSYIHSIL